MRMSDVEASQATQATQPEIQTQPDDDTLLCASEQLEPQPWGYLYPIKYFDPITLKNNSETLGRHSKCDVIINHLQVSNKHCKLFREPVADGKDGDSSPEYR